MNKSKSYIKYDPTLVKFVCAECLNYGQLGEIVKRYKYRVYFEYEDQKYYRDYSVRNYKKSEIDDIDQDAVELFYKDVYNGKVEKQVMRQYNLFKGNIDYKPTKYPNIITKRDYKPLFASLFFLLFAGGIGGTLYAFKDVIFNKSGEVRRKYNVTYDCRGGSLQGQEKKIINEENVIQTAPYPNRDNYLFEGWYKEESCQNKVTFPYTLSSNSTFYAKWKPAASLTHQVFFETNSESCSIPFLIVHHGDNLNKYGQLSKPTKKDFEFDGWYYDNDSFNKPVDLNNPIDNNIILYAKYHKIAFTVTFDTDGGEQPSGTTSTGELNKYTMSSLSSLTIEPFCQKQKTSGGYYAFQGWMDTNGDPISYPLVLHDDNVVLKAKWEDKSTYTASFLKSSLDSVPFKTVRATHVSTPPTATEVTDNPNYKLLGWYDFDDIQQNLIDFSVSGGYKLTKDTKFVAKWELVVHEVKLYTVVDGVPTLKETRQCAAINKDPGFIVEDCELVAWYTNEACTSETVDFNQGITINENCEFYAKYERNCFDVEYLNDDNTRILSLKHVSVIKEGDLPYVKRVNHKVTWTIKGEAITIPTEGLIVKNYLTEGETKLTIKAEWTKNAYNLTLKYPTIEDELVHADVELDGQNVVTLDSLKKYEFSGYSENLKAYKCVGWSYTDGGTLIEDTSITLDKDTTLYAKYDIRVFTVTLKHQSKTGETLLDDTSKPMNYGNHNVSELSTGTITGRPFEKWVYDDEYKTEVSESFVVYSDLTLIAQYDKTYTVELYYRTSSTGEGTKIDDLTEQKVLHLDDLKKKVPSTITTGGKYKFDNWTISEGSDKFYEIIGESVNVTEKNEYEENKVKIYLNYEQCAFKVTFKNGETAVGATLSKNNGDIIKANEVPILTDPTKVFNGWIRSDDTTQTVINFDNNDYEFNATQDVIFMACWDRDNTVTFKIAADDYEKGIAYFKSDSVAKSQTVTTTDKKITSTSYKDISGFDLILGEVPGKNYIQDGWYILDDGQKVRFDNFPITNATNLILYPNFVENTSKVSLLLDSGEGKFSDGTTQIILTPEHGTTIANLKTDPKYKEPILNDYVFSCWSIYDSKEEKYVELSDNYQFTGNQYLHPIFKEDIQTPTSFATDNWATFSAIAENKVTDANGNAYANGFEALKDKYKNEYENNGNTFVGLTRNISMNIEGYSKSSFGVKVVGQEHDIISNTNKKAALTFMLTSAPYKDFHNPVLKTGLTNNWAISSLRISLMKQPDGSEGKSYKLIETTLKNHAQFVDKYTRLGKNDAAKCNDKETTSDQFFLFSGTELGLTDSKYDYNLDCVSYAANEGTKYEGLSDSADILKRTYYNDSTKTDEYVKWYIRSPYNHTHYNNSGMLGSAINRINEDGGLVVYKTEGDHFYGDTLMGIIFGFAIGIGGDSSF